jgi:hypothetical protein
MTGPEPGWFGAGEPLPLAVDADVQRRADFADELRRSGYRGVRFQTDTIDQLLATARNFNHMRQLADISVKLIKGEPC